MTDLLPIIEQLANVRDHGERVEWLLQCPLGVLSRYSMTIRNRLMHAGFQAGIDYLDALDVARSSVRAATGEIRPETAELLAIAVDNMRKAARTVSAADHSITEL